MSRFAPIVAFAALVLLAGTVFADDVVVLTAENFDKEVGQDRGALVEFYAPWYHGMISLMFDSNWGKFD